MDIKVYSRAVNKYRQRFLDEGFKGLEISRGEAPFLNKIVQAGDEILMNDLIEQLFFHKSHATRSINKLVEDGLVIKTKNKNDLRGYVLSATDKGRQVAKQVQKVFADWDKLMDEIITDEEKEMFNKLTIRIYHQLRNYFNEEDTINEDDN